MGSSKSISVMAVLTFWRYAGAIHCTTSDIMEMGPCIKARGDGAAPNGTV